ncbi:MAG: polyprenyl synthetase family protein [Paracoccaceae bacterium]
MGETFQGRLTAAQGTVAAGMRDALSGRIGVLPEAMLYAIEGGKCLRAFLALESARLHGADGRAAALAIEAVHAYSLIHDDLPCMDDDDLRRGKPTVHRKWDETIAILAGDALNTLAFELLAEGDALPLVGSLARAAGTEGMIGGQMMDIAAETAATPLDLARITALQAGKTGALITWSALVGPRLAKADEAPLRTYGDALGLAFQIADDLLDVEGNAEAVGKAVGKDADAGKATFVSLLGLDAARARADALVTEACDALAPYGAAADPLRDAARFVVTRDR